jgi:uncharacterized protein YcbK (DUF882 family)
MHARQNRFGFLVSLCVAVIVLLIQGCIFRKPTDAQRYALWERKHTADIAEYQAFLDHNEVGDIIPLSQLLKSARDWKKCKAEPFTMPPKELWPNIVSTLQIVKKFKSEGMLINPVAASVYRDPVLNTCAGGSPKSKHMQLNAIDFDIDATPESLGTLCHAWKTLGPELQLGLGFYTPTRIHLDTQGFRSWGTDYTFKTSPCLQEK